jgi:EAL domain-containing protein (putative c-di-GMP-specific phosphodiesterase class I)
MRDRPSSPRRRRERRSPTPAAAQKRAAIHKLKAALAEERLVLHYQPIVGARDSRLVDVEALLRWRSPRKERAKIEDLLRSAESSPVIFELENWALERAAQEAREWQGAGLPGVRVNVNLSAREFPRADLVGRVKRRLASAGLDPRGLVLEVTETSRIEDFDAVADQIQRLITLGIELWLDDFGTGHSSLEWLSHLPLHGVKIAGTFVERLPTEKRCQVIVARVIDLAHDFKLRVVAEGVENEQQRDFLVRCGCDLLQGFLFHAAMPAEKLLRALAGPRTSSGTLRA